MILSEDYKNRLKFLAFSNANENHNSMLQEGRYDKLTGDLTDIIWGFIRNAKRDDESEVEYQYPIKLKEADIDLNVIIKRESDIDYHMAVDGSQLNNEIDIYLHLNKDTEPIYYTKLNAKIQDTVRHELEHLFQTPGTVNYKRNRPTPTKPTYRKQLKDKRITYRYFTLRDETPSMVVGMYRQAKIEKRSLNDVLKEYLGYFLTSGDITQKQHDKILRIWLDYAKHNLPRAKYS